MNQLVRIWNSLSTAQRISLVVVPVLLCAGIIAFARWKYESDFKTLFSGLTPEDAAAVTQRVREAGIEFRMDESGGSVLVPSARLAEARLALAGAGIPRSGRIGFELFDRTNLGASDFTEQVNYRRALEGELEKTVATLSEVDQARIHITPGKESVFLESRQPAKATVVLKIKSRAGSSSRLSDANVYAVANLVASAVDGLSPDAVAIIDTSGRLLNRPRADGDNEARVAEANLDFRHQLETQLLTRINAAVEPLVGPGKFHAGINVDCDFTSAEESEESYDPAKSTILTSQSTEESTASAGGGGAPGTASNLPQPPPRATTGSTGITRKTESVSYQPGHTIRRTLSPRGTVRRISTAVLVDQSVRWDGVGPKAKKSFVPPSPEVIKGIHDVVAGIIGYTETRGDQLTVESLPLENTVSAEPPPAPPTPPAARKNFDFKQPVVLGGAAAILILLLVIGFLLMRRPKKKTVMSVEDVGAAALPGGENAVTVPQETADQRLERQMEDNDAEQAQLEADALSRIKLPANTKKTEVLVKHIRESVQKDPNGAANVLRTWVAELETRR